MEKAFIFSPRVAKDLIKNDYKVIDIAENQKDKKKSVFVFEKTDKLLKHLEENWDIAL